MARWTSPSAGWSTGATALTVLLTACGAGRTEPLLEPTGPAVISGHATITPIRFGTKNDAPELVEVDAELGMLTVPERHADPGGRTLRTRYVRLPGRAGATGPPIVYLAGGPGGSGVWSAAGDRFVMFDRLRAVADVIAYDQRGTWGSEPHLVCPGSWDHPLGQPLDGESLAVAMQPFLESCWSHWGQKVDLGAFNTVESAEDLEVLRQTLGVERLTLLGISYGTHLALAYLRAHPDRVHRAILAGVEGPDDTYKLPSRVDAVFHRVVAAIDDDPDARSVLPDFENAFRSLVERLQRDPLEVELDHPETGARVTVVVGPEDLRRALFDTMGEREDLVELVMRAAPVLSGDFAELGADALAGRLGNRASAMALSMDCASGASAERRDAIERQAPVSLMGARSESLAAACPNWPVADLGDEFRSPLESDAPVLLVSGSLDPKTPLENAEALLPGMPNGRHLVIEGGSHDDDLLISSPEIVEAMVAFLEGRETPESISLGPLDFDIP